MISEFLNYKLSCSCGCSMPFLHDINESEDYIDIKKVNLLELFNKWNKELFGGELRVPDKLNFASLDSKNASGIAYCKVEFTDHTKKRFTKIWDSKITISNKNKYTIETLNQILIHEMIHWYYLSIEMVDEGHGIKFKSMANKISSKVGFEIPLSDEVTERDDRLENFKDVGIFVFNIDGVDKATISSANSFDKAKEQLSNTLKGTIIKDNTKITYGLGKFPQQSLYPVVRTFNKMKLYRFEDILKTVVWSTKKETTKKDF